MRLSYKPFVLEFKHPFGVSSNTRTHTTSVFVKLECKGAVGYGEACLPAYLGESEKGTLEFLGKVKPVLARSDTSVPIPELLEKIDSLSVANNAAKAAVDTALYDLYGRISNMSYREMMGFTACDPKATSFTIGIDTEEILEQKIKEAGDFGILKIKAGTADDKKLINLVRKYTDKPLYVDVNQGWTDKHHVLEMIHWMNDRGVLLIEQPMPVAMMDEMRWVTSQSPLPVIADESVKRLADLERLGDAFSGINIKLMKCTGLAEALKMIGYARDRGIKILLGCMAESSCGTTAMAQLMSFADHIDLDAPLLYKNDPFTGVLYKEGKVHVSEKIGIGAHPTVDLW